MRRCTIPRLTGRHGQRMKDEELEDSEDLEDADDEEEVEEEGEAAGAAPAPADGEVEGEVESSLEELIAKKEDRKPAAEEEEAEAMLTAGREARLETQAGK